MRAAVRIAMVVALGALVALSWTPVATGFENEAFGITPFPERTNGSDRSSFSIPLETGATFEDAVRIYNLTDEPLVLALYATDAQAALDNKISVGLREEHPEGVGKWIDLPLKRIELEARDGKTVSFRVKVRSSDPDPELGAIVVENTGRGLAGNATQRLHVLVRTVPPNTPTSSKRVRAFPLQSPWVAIASIGLVVAGALVWIGARRARRPRDLVVQPGSFDEAHDEAAIVPPASRPVIKRPGTSRADPDARTGVLDRVRAGAGARRRDERPLLDDALLVEVDENESIDDRSDEKDVSPEPPSWTRAPVQRDTAARREPAAGNNKTAPSRTRKGDGPRRATAAKHTQTAKPLAAKAKAKPRPSGRKAKATAKAKPKAKAKATARKPKPPQDKNFIPLKDL